VARPLHLLQPRCSAPRIGPQRALRSAGTPAAIGPGVALGDTVMTRTELRSVQPDDAGNIPSRAGETIAEVAFALLLVGVWMVTCVVG
jgi:hypothetical protein